MIDIRTGKDLKEYAVLEEPKIRIYVLLNESGKVKIGKTKDIYKRYLSLCGSNGQGVEICKCFVSDETYLFSLEETMHNKFSHYRISNTEWFYDKKDSTGENLFMDATEYLELLFSSTGYERCNELRKKMYETKGGDKNDH